MQESVPSLGPLYASSLIMLMALVVATGCSIFASRIHILIGVALEFLSRGFVALVWLVYLFLTVPPLKKVFEEFGLSVNGPALLMTSLIGYWYILLPVMFLALVINTAIFAVAVKLNRNAASIWSAFVSVQFLIVCLVSIFIMIRPLLELRGMAG